MATSIKKVSNVKTYDSGTAMHYSWAQSLRPGEHREVVLVQVHRTWNGDPARDNVLSTVWPHVPPDEPPADLQN